MADRTRRGMLIKNLGERTLTIRMMTRKLQLSGGEEAALTPEEVRDPELREHLQLRTVAVVRPTTPEEDEALQRELNEE
ncbi:MAG: hypothetical protein R3362_05700 [Rhodothermales bacterium]|nr:hypothetical protein [Rhodothermales bacterium]